jgi:hypothetical protein
MSDLLERMIEQAATRYLDARGFQYAHTPEEGQDAYDITREACELMMAVLKGALPPLVSVLEDVHGALGYYLSHLPDGAKDNRAWMRGYEALKALAPILAKAKPAAKGEPG